MVCCLCCATGPVTGVFHIDRCGYVPGEAIPFKAEMQNNSDREILSNKVKLICVSHFLYFIINLYIPQGNKII